MNYLAHAVLSFADEEILVGNMISDFVKGRYKLTFPPGIQRGIELHRKIDAFTDLHPCTAEAKNFFRPVYRLYSGAFVDIVYDHFLANDPHEFKSAADLLDFSSNTYRTLETYQPLWPVIFSALFPYMKFDNWLFNYRLVTGIEKSFGGLVRRALYIHSSSEAYEIFIKNYTALELCYENFFPELREFAMNTLRNLQAE